MVHDHSETERLSNHLLTLVGIELGRESVGEVQSFLDAGEYGVAFELLCSLLQERGVALTTESKQAVKALAERMNIEPSWWIKLVG